MQYRIKEIGTIGMYELQRKWLGLFWANCSMNAYRHDYASEKLRELQADTGKRI